MERLFAGGEMGALIREFDWASTSLGMIASWSQSLQTAVNICLNSRFPMVVWWGKELVLLYNDAWRPILGTKHPDALGRPGQVVWAEIWDIIGAQLNSVLATAQATWSDDMLLLVDRYGYTEEAYFTYSYSPIFLETGAVGGAFTAVTETTKRVIGERRLSTLRELAANTVETKSVEQTCQSATHTLAKNPHDIPIALLYLIDPDRQARLMGTAGIEADTVASPLVIDLNDFESSQVWSFTQVLEIGEAIVIHDLIARFGVLPGGAWDDALRSAIVLPIAQSGQPGQKQQLIGFLVLGISPRREFDDEYQGFFDLVANNVATAIANTTAYEEERKRAEALAELDRAKTVFFSNVSHEFRTPLTLMLGPIEDALTDTSALLPAPQQDRIELVQRNGLRLLKLVNTLLDFSRIEAGRIQAVYEPTDLATFTSGLASVFRSVIERAGLQLSVNCPSLPEFVYVDREMWEKIVLNLLSNAFKFTFEGEIAVSLQQVENQVELTVQDTGIGISAESMPHLFERFYRVLEARGRTCEGSGIGLSLVQELVKLHGGTIQVNSTIGQGTCFTIALPTGSAHLPIERIGTARVSASTASAPYVAEALRWQFAAADREYLLPATTSPLAPASLQAATARILLADDNADMRDYVRRLLSQQYEVETVADGVAALAAIRQQMPDLVLTDVMMPQLNGFELLRELRSDPTTQEIPIVLLSARAGEESRIEGLEAGADDYLIKPFSARELLARVEANLKMAQLRQEAAKREQGLRVEAQTAKANLENVLSRLDDQFLALDREWRYTYANDQASAVIGISKETLLGQCIWEVFPNIVGSQFYTEVHRAVAEQAPVRFEYCYPALNRWFENRVYPSLSGLSLFVADITEQKRAQQKLQQTLQTLSTLIEASPLPIVVIEPDMIVQLWNPAAEQLFGWREAEVLGQPIPIVPEEKREECRQVREAVANGEVIAGVETYRCKQDGSTVIVSISAAPLYDEQGHVNASVLIFQDITQRQQAEAALREAHVQLESALVAGAVYTWRWNIAEDRLTTNAAFAHLFGVDPVDAAAGLPLEVFANAIHDEDRSQVLAAVNWAVETGEEYVAEYRVRTATGEERWVFARGQVECDAAGRAISFPGALADITDRKQARSALRRSEERYRTLFESIDEGFCIVEMLFDENDMPIDYRFLESNPAFEHQTGLRQAIGKTARQLLPNLEADWIRIYGNVALTGEPARFENGSEAMNRWFDVYACRTGEPETRKVAIVFKDVSDRKRIEQERQQLLQHEQAAREAAETANRIKDEFLAVLSHELRSPLNPILGWSKLLRNGNLDAAKTAYALETIERNAKLQTQLIEDLLDVSRILQGKLSLNMTPVNLALTIEASLETVRLAAEAKSIQVRTAFNLTTGQVLGDAARLQQVIWNLLSNAVKFTPQNGQVEIRLERSGSQAQIQVSDTGKGIPPDFLPHVFEYFRQADATTTRKFGGLGLGLAIVRHLIELHGGTVQADSAGEGQGATFTVRLPLLMDNRVEDRQSGSPPLLFPDSPLAGTRVLLVDDEPDTRELIAFTLEQSGAIVTSATSAIEALQALAQTKFDLLVSDIGMPEMDGYMLMQHIRAMPPEQGGNIRAIALTAYAGEVNQQQALAAGFQQHVTKPVAPNELIQAVIHLAEATSTQD